MSKDQSFHDYMVYDLLAEIPGITSRAMFSGWGIYQNGIIFAIIANGALYFKVGKNNQPDFEKLGSHPFTYPRQGKTATLSYWLLPEEIMEDREKLVAWIAKAVKISKHNDKH